MNAARANEKALAFMEVAETLAKLGTCDRKQVGCVIVRDGRCVSWGYNGAPPGLMHCVENGHGWGEVDREEGKADLKTLSQAALDRMADDLQPDHIPWDWQGGVDYLTRRYGCRNATHAEANALAAAAKQGISTERGTLLTTCSPCDNCSRLIIAAGIARVYYREEYRDDSGLKLLAAAGIIPNQL